MYRATGLRGFRGVTMLDAPKLPGGGGIKTPSAPGTKTPMAQSSGGNWFATLATPLVNAYAASVAARVYPPQNPVPSPAMTYTPPAAPTMPEWLLPAGIALAGVGLVLALKKR